MTKIVTILIIMAISSTVLAAPSLAACRTDDIEIRQSDWQRLSTGTTVKIVGEFFNRCAESVTILLAFTFRDTRGLVVSVQERWPNGNGPNVESKASYPFELIIPDIGVSASTMTTRVLQAEHIDFEDINARLRLLTDKKKES